LEATNEENRINKNKIGLQKGQITTLSNSLEKLQNEAVSQKQEAKILKAEIRGLQSNNDKLTSQLRRGQNN